MLLKSAPPLHRSFNEVLLLAQRDLELNIKRVQSRVLRRRPDIMGDFSSKLFTTLRSVQIAAHMMAIRDATRKAQLSFSFRDILTELEVDSGADAEELERIYNTSALRISDDVSDKVNRSLQDMIAEGTTLVKLKKAFNEFGIDGFKDHQIATILETQARISYGAGEWNTYQSLSNVWGFEYVDVGDEKVRPTHHAANGTVLPKDHIFWQTWWPPNGWNCRCRVIPIFQPKQHKFAGDAAQVDSGFAFNPGVVFPTAQDPINFEPTKLKPRSKQRALTRQQTEAVAAIVPRSGPVETTPVLDRAVSRSRLTQKKVVYAAVPADVVQTDSGKVRLTQPVITKKKFTPEVSKATKVVVRVETSPGDVGLVLDGDHIILPRDREYRVKSRRKVTHNGRTIYVVTLTQT